MSNGGADTQTVDSQVPARIDRLSFAQWHWLVIAALGITWILDGLEVTMVGNIAVVLTDPESGLGLSEGQVGTAGGIYIAGACTAGLMIAAAVTELVLGVRAEQRPLKDVATPLTAIQEETGSSA